MKFLRAASVITLCLEESKFKESFINAGIYHHDSIDEEYQTTLETTMKNEEWGEDKEFFALSLAIGRPIYSYNPCITGNSMNRSDIFDFEELQSIHLNTRALNEPGIFMIFTGEEFANHNPIAIYNNTTRTHYTALLRKTVNSRYFKPNATYNKQQ